jgi:hypothetical protein
MNDTTSKTGTTVFGLTKIPEDANLGWVDSTEPDGPKTNANPFVGGYAYGISPLGFDQHMLHVNSGAPVMGYAFGDDGELLLLGLVAGRWNLNDGQHLAEVPGGFGQYDPETGVREFPKKGALRELAEETGLEPNDVVMVDGEPFIGDRAFFWKLVGEGNSVGMFELDAPAMVAIQQNPSLTLLNWNDFQKQSPDGITLGSILRVMGGLYEAGLLKVCKA